MSDTPDRSSDLSRIFDEFLVKRQLGESPVLDEYCQRFPDLAEQLRVHVRLYDALETARPEGETTLCDHGVLPRIPGYEVEAVLGQGGAGVVFRARHLRLGRPVALKMLLAGAYAGPTELMRFQLEAEAVAGLCHPNVVQLYEVAEHEGRPYFTMELVDGGSLAQKIAATPTVNTGGSQAKAGNSQQVRWAAQLVATLAEAVSVAHRAGILHRDLKPGNILLTADGTPKISDFGLARRLKGEGSLTCTGTAVGTPSYMSPEQASDTAGSIGPATDVYGLGAVLYELLTGRPPFRARTPLETLQQVLSQEPAPPSRSNPRVPRDLETVCLKCLQKNAQRRYTSAVALAEDLQRYLLGQVVTARPVSSLERAVKWVRRNKWVAGLAAAAVFALLAGSGIALAIRNHFQEQNQADRARGLVNQVLAAKIDKVPPIIQEIENYRLWADPLLREENDRAGAESPQKLHTSLALLPVDPGQTNYLYDRLLDAEPHEVPVIVDALAPHKQELLEKLWSVVENPGKGKEKQRLRAAAALASFDSESDKWVKYSPSIVSDLVLENPFFLGQWRESFRPVKNSFLEPLSALFRNHSPERSDERMLATNLLTDYAADQPGVLADLLMDADEKQFARIYALVEKNKDFCIATFARVVAEQLGVPKEKIVFESTGVIAENDPKVKPPVEYLKFRTQKEQGLMLPSKRFAVQLQRGKTYVLTMTSVDLDSFLVLRDKTGIDLAFDDDSGGEFNALLTYTPSADDIYTVFAASLADTGSFQLRIFELIADDPREKLAKRQANAAVALLRLKQEEKVWPLLARSQEPDDPRVRSYLIHRFGPLGAEAAAIIKRLEEEKDVTVQRALVLSLGEFGAEQLPPHSRRALLPKLRAIYQTDADAGLHGATEWLLRQWDDREWLQKVNLEWAKGKEAQAKQLDAIKQQLKASQAAPAPHAAQWYVDGQGHTMVVIPDLGKPFLMGSPITEVGRDRDATEIQHKMRIPRTFALAAKPVTWEQYMKFYDKIVAPLENKRMANLPAVGRSWFMAAAYCNWLSQQEGIDPTQWCYEIEPAREPGGEVKVVRLRENYLSLQGYRLPTEAEMEYAIRAGAVTSRFFGDKEDLLPKYGWYTDNSRHLTWPVGILKPNDFGFFDVHGNVTNWCQERWYTTPRAASEDEEDLALEVEPKRLRKTRGASFGSRASQARSASGHCLEPEDNVTQNGIRVARTIPLDPLTTLPLPSPKGSHNQIVLDKKDSLSERDSGWMPSNPKGDPLLKLVSGNPHKFYTLTLMKEDRIIIRLKSKGVKIDPVVAIEDSKKILLAYNDDEDYANNILDSKLVVAIPEDGEYRIIATCSHEQIRNKYGDFHLTVEKTTTIPPADAKAEPLDKAKLVGTWEFVKTTEKKSPLSGSTAEFAKDGKLKMSIQSGNQAKTIEGTYSLEGDTLKIVTEGRDGKDATETMRIVRLTDKELVTEEMTPGNTGTTELRKK